MDSHRCLPMVAGLPRRSPVARVHVQPSPKVNACRRNVLQFVALAIGAVAAARAEVTFYTARVAPIFEKHCVACHGAEKHKAALRLDTFEHAMRGGEAGWVIKPDDVKGSELYRRITLPATDEDVMPGDGKPLLSADEIKIIELWISSGASQTKPLADFPSAPVPRPAKAPTLALAPDWRPMAAEIVALEKQLGLRIVPRSQVPTDGLILRTASAPRHCDDAVLKKLTALAPLIVDAELARTRVTDEGVKVLGTFENLRSIDLTRTAISSKGLSGLSQLRHLEALNLTDTAIDDEGVARLKGMRSLKRVWLFGTKATVTELPGTIAAH